LIHTNVEKIRIAKGVTKTFLANKIELSLQGYRHIAAGSVRLDVERLKTIGKVLNVDPSIFFDDKLTESVIYDLRQSNEKEVI
jgi:transcriptional regulator with XRE-family HTH domain